jgi:hypothetical protein
MENEDDNVYIPPRNATRAIAFPTNKVIQGYAQKTGVRASGTIYSPHYHVIPDCPIQGGVTVLKGGRDIKIQLGILAYSHWWICIMVENALGIFQLQQQVYRSCFVVVHLFVF